MGSSFSGYGDRTAPRRDVKVVRPRCRSRTRPLSNSPRREIGPPPTSVLPGSRDRLACWFVVHQKQWVDGDVHVSFVENAWSLFKRGLVGMYHHVSTKYLQEYLDEFAFTYSHRHEKERLLDLVLMSSPC